MNQSLQEARDIITGYRGPKLRIMEVCGTHTHEIFRLGIRQLLPESIELISGPGCPVCVTPTDFIDEAIWLATEKQVTICTFGDLVRVPGTTQNLGEARAAGANVQVVYTPLDAVTYAAEHPSEAVAFLSVGFETTTPAACLAVKRAMAQGLTNFSLLTANKTMDQAYLAMADACDAYLYPGHVCAIAGTALPEQLVHTHGISGVATGFTASELLTALAVIIRKQAAGKPFFVNCYPRVVTHEGSPAAQKLVRTLMEPCDAEWRGLGTIPQSGLQLRADYGQFDARVKYQIPAMHGHGNPACRCGDICRANARRPIARSLAKSAILSTRSVPAWCPMKVPAPHSISMEGISDVHRS
jgi:hydrogenase expression/formation protein HypD